MSKKIRQTTSKEEDFYTKNLINNNELVSQIGIQAPVGTQFTINNSDKINIGKTGIYELSLNDNSYIYSLKIEKLFESEQIIIVDILYEEKEEV